MVCTGTPFEKKSYRVTTTSNSINVCIGISDTRCADSSKESPSHSPGGVCLPSVSQTLLVFGTVFRREFGMTICMPLQCTVQWPVLFFLNLICTAGGASPALERRLRARRRQVSLINTNSA